MPRRPTTKPGPDAPDLALELLEPAPGPLAERARWVAVRADGELAVAGTATDAELRESVLTGVDLAQRDLSRLVARDVRFERCDLSGAVLDGATLTRVEFAGCRMTGAMLSDAVLQDVLLRDCRADLTNWRMTRAAYLLASSCSLREADFYRTSLTNAGLLDCDLRQAGFRDCRLQDVDLHGSRLDDLREAGGLSGAAIGADQVLPVALALLAAGGITVTEQPRLGGGPGSG